MQQGIHPTYGPVVFKDRSTGRTYLTRSTMVERAERTIELDGVTYPLVDVDVTADSHPFWTGTTRTLDSEGRVQAFERRYGKRTRS